MDEWTGRTALARLAEIDGYIVNACDNKNALEAAYGLNFAREFPLIATFLKALVQNPESGKRLLRFVDHLSQYSPTSKPRLLLMKLLARLPILFWASLSRFYRALY